MITSQPDSSGHFGPYGGRFVPEVLMAPLEELEQAYLKASADPSFEAELAERKLAVAVLIDRCAWCGLRSRLNCHA